MTQPRVMLLSPVAPWRSGVGGLWVSNITRMYPEMVKVYLDDSPDEWESHTSDGRTYCFKRPNENGIRSVNGRFSSILRMLYESYIWRRYGRDLVSDIVNVGRTHKIDKIFAYLQTSTMLRIINPIVQQLGLPLITLVTDPPRFKLLQRGLDPLTRRLLLHEFSRAVKTSTKCGVMSTNMKVDYEKRYGTSCIVFHHAIYAPALGYGRRKTAEFEEFVIGFAGTINSHNEWAALLEALDTANWSISGRSVKVRILGPVANLRSRTSASFEYLGWRSEEETIRFLSETDIAYLPYRFEEEYLETACLAFPSKLSTYVAAGVPIFYHGPEESSVVSFLKEHRVGHTCFSLSSAQIVHAIESAVNDVEFFEAYSQNRNRAIDLALSPSVFESSLYHLINS